MVQAVIRSWAAIAAVACSCGHLVTATAPVRVTLVDRTIESLQWNPHWECFEKSTACAEAVTGQLSTRLTNTTDFANLVEVPPVAIDAAKLDGWTRITNQCGIDTTSLLFNSRRWRKVDVLGSAETGCMEKNDRPFTVQVFESLGHEATAAAGGFKVLVVAAHFPHGPVGDALPAAVRHVTATTGVTATLLIADTNMNAPSPKWWPWKSGTSNADIMKAIGASDGEGTGSVKSTDLLDTCCLNFPGFWFKFDRIIANFGTSMSTELYDKHTPHYATGEFHKAIRGTLTLSSSNIVMRASPASESLLV
eukprot:TRINITY_DN521_c0_g1_i3.p1 TRINITY_DN521_c0_g1~~TRINITY_DN521_c0_g1_i3.p1  ORF type:complete len:307 (-),score=35.10 TRINITY_DN521_c0_g1_i3:82-1002(-)